MNVVHLLADQAPVDNDRRRIFPLVVSARHLVDRVVMFGLFLHS